MMADALLKVRVVPNARKTEFAGYRGAELLLRLNAPPVDGKANIAAIAHIARCFEVSRSSVVLVSGEKSRHKIFQIVGLERDDLDKKLARLQS
jgi:uncharacterized protein (TIGR00251 family)